MTAALAALLLGACGDDSGGDAPETGPPATGAPTAPPDTFSPVLPTLPSPSLPPRNGEQTITGEITAGVEPGCVLLTTEVGDYLLFGDASEGLTMGATVTLRGQVRPDMASTCQQGTPFEVLEVLE